MSVAIDERVYLGPSNVENAQLHLCRYVFALNKVFGKRVCDVGSGSGYGSWLLAHYATEVVGVEIDEEAFRYAVGRYTGLPNVSFHRKDWLADNAVEGLFDVIVAFESLEHTQDMGAGLRLCRERLHEGGTAIVSLPLNQGHERNEFHLTGDLTYADCVATISEVFPEGHYFHQPMEEPFPEASNVTIRPMTPLSIVPSRGFVVFMGMKP